MRFQDALHNLVLAEDIAPDVGKLKLIWQKELAGMTFFSFEDRNYKGSTIGDDADYLKLFMQVAEKLFQETKDRVSTYICACTLKGQQLLIKPFTDSERDQFHYSKIALSNALKQLSGADPSLELNFFAEISFEDSQTPKFEKEAQKVAKLLKGENREDWMIIAENRYSFLKTDLYIYFLDKLHSWGFQYLTPDGSLNPKLSMVRPIKPKPRGAIREKRRRDR